MSTRKSKSEKRVMAKAVMVAASACESARLLLNSKSTLFPDGLANSSGAVGRNLMDSVGSDGGGFVPRMEKVKPHNHDGVGGLHMYVPWWKFDRKNDFPRGYHIELGVAATCPAWACSMTYATTAEGYGVSLKQRLPQRIRNLSRIRGARGDDPESRQLLRTGSRPWLTNGESRCCVSISSGPTTKSRWRRICRRVFKSIIEAAGGTYYHGDAMRTANNPYGILDGGVIIHEVGTARMGADPEDFGAERILPGPRCEEPLRHRWGDVRDQSGQESDAHDHGAVVARVGSPAGRSEKGKSVADQFEKS